MADGEASADILHLEPHITCSCHGRIAIPDDVVRGYLHGERATCTRCGATGDWWEELLGATKSVMTVPLAVVGAHLTLFQLVLEKGEQTEVDFLAAGVPEHARILRVFYSAVGDDDQPPLFPLQMLISQPEPPWIGRKFPVYPLSTSVSAESSRVNVLVAWLPPEEASTARAQLIDAFDAYARSNYEPPDFEGCIIPANTAVEVALGALLAERLAQDVSATRVRDFLDNAATYGHQLNILLPVLAKAVAAPELPSGIRGALNRLRKLRNQLAHEGAPQRPITKDEAAKCVCAAFFGVGYVRFLKPLLLTH